jgi:glutaredoxin
MVAELQGRHATRFFRKRVFCFREEVMKTMLLDSLNGVLPPQAMEVKVEKKKDPEETKPIEQSGESRHPQLELQQQNISKETKIKQVFKEEQRLMQIYNAKGNLVQKAIHKQKAENLNLTV